MASETAPQDQKKRSLAALERRFAAAKAELVQQQQQQQKKDIKHGKEPNCVGSSSVASTTVIADVSVIPTSKKGLFFLNPKFLLPVSIVYSFETFSMIL